MLTIGQVKDTLTRAPKPAVRQRLCPTPSCLRGPRRRRGSARRPRRQSSVLPWLMERCDGRRHCSKPCKTRIVCAFVWWVGRVPYGKRDEPSRDAGRGWACVYYRCHFLGWGLRTVGGIRYDCRSRGSRGRVRPRQKTRGSRYLEQEYLPVMPCATVCIDA
jgi:hypothetical protein